MSRKNIISAGPRPVCSGMSTVAERIEISILGPLQLIGSDGPIYLRGRRQRVVLATLVLHANRMTTLEQLIDAAWGRDSPRTCRTQVQATISGLRRLFASIDASARIVTRDPGYVLQVNRDLVDSHVFGQRVQAAKTHELDGDHQQAVAELRSALSLWRGPALADISDGTVRLAAGRLDELRIMAEVDRIGIELRLGRHVEVIPDLRALVEAHPLREELYRDLMLALYRSGRQFEALDTFRRARRTLVEEIGVEPSEELRGLERAVLRRDKTLDLAVTTPNRITDAAPIPPQASGSLPPGIADFTGRDDELAQVIDLLSGVDNDVRLLPTVAISGRGGVGKTCLAVQAAHLLRQRFPDGPLYADLGQAGSSDDVLSHFLCSLGVPAALVPETTQDKVEMYRGLLCRRSALVVVDNAPSEDRVLPLLPGVPSCAALVTSRSPLSALPSTRWIHLSALDQDESLTFLIRQLGHDRVQAEHLTAVRLAELCAGLPLALRIVAARLAARPHLRMAELVDRLADETRRLDELSHRGLDVRSAIASSYAALPGEASRLFRRLGMLGAAYFSPQAAAAALGTDVESASQVLDLLADEGILDVVESGDSVRYLSDPLIRAYAQERLTQTEPSETRELSERQCRPDGTNGTAAV